MNDADEIKILFTNFFSLFKDFIYLLFERGEGREKEREINSICERHIDLLPLARPQMGTWPPSQACALTGN